MDEDGSTQDELSLALERELQSLKWQVEWIRKRLDELGLDGDRRGKDAPGESGSE